VSAGAAADLDRKLADYARGTGHQVLIYVDRTTGGVPIEDWAVEAFERWKVGRKGIDDGLVLFVMTDDHALRIEVGYGLEPTMTDARASRIIRDVIAPRIRAGDHDGAMRAGVDAILATLGGAGQPAAAPAVQRQVPAGRVVAGMVGLVVLFVLFVGFALTHPGLAWLLTTMIGSGRRGGGWGGGGGGFSGGGGGFSGGGGRSGGGGASGSW
jgi:uncharacterized protein